MILRVISYLLNVLIAGAFAVLVIDARLPAEQKWWRSTPCTQPLTWRIGEMDERFGLSKEELKRFTHAAGKLWSDATEGGRPLFEYDPDGDVAIHLIYDERQQMIEGEMGLAGQINEERQRYDRLHAEYLQLADHYEGALSDYQTLRKSYEEKLAVHNRRVDEWNAGEGGPQEMADELVNSARELEQMKQALQEHQGEVNQAGAAVQSHQFQLEEIFEKKDQLISQYNRQFAGEHRLSQGEYVNREGEQRINIYHYLTLNHLLRVLAHEMGHALGLGHVESRESVMHPVADSRTGHEVRLSAEDLSAIQARCRMSAEQ